VEVEVEMEMEGVASSVAPGDNKGRSAETPMPAVEGAPPAPVMDEVLALEEGVRYTSPVAPADNKRRTGEVLAPEGAPGGGSALGDRHVVPLGTRKPGRNAGLRTPRDFSPTAEGCGKKI